MPGHQPKKHHGHKKTHPVSERDHDDHAFNWDILLEKTGGDKTAGDVAEVSDLVENNEEHPATTPTSRISAVPNGVTTEVSSEIASPKAPGWCHLPAVSTDYEGFVIEEIALTM